MDSINAGAELANLHTGVASMLVAVCGTVGTKINAHVRVDCKNWEQHKASGDIREYGVVI